MRIIRIVLGFFILFLDRIFAPKPEFIRTEGEQLKIDSITQGWALYQLPTCPFCVKVRRELKRLAITIPLRNINDDPNAAQELTDGGKLDQVPCLRMPGVNGDQWLYESSDINAFLRKTFGQSGKN